jgi:succinyldiaminopimelate transaminase
MHNDRLDSLPPSPFATRLPRLLHGLEPLAEARPIDMSIGEPCHAVPAMVRAAIVAHLDALNAYPSTIGTPALRQAIAGFLERRYSLSEGTIDPDTQVLPLSGTREGLFMAALAAVPERKAGTKPAVLIPNPLYYCYVGAAVAAGAEPVLVPATPETGFLPDYLGLPEAILARTAMVYLCSPANPQGAVAGPAYLARLIDLARRHDFILAVDECYSEIYPDTPPPGVLEVCRDLGGCANLVTFNSLSKRSNVAGLRSGFVAGDPAFIRRFAHLRNYGATAMPTAVVAASTALWKDDEHVRENRALYRAKFDLAERLLAGRFGFYRPAGGFFLWLDVGDGEAATRRLWAEAAVKVVPGAYLALDDPRFGNPGKPYIRVALVHDMATTAEALARIAKIA